MRFYGPALGAALRLSLIPLICGGLAYHGGLPQWLLGTGPYHRRVQEPVSEVTAALEDLDTDDFNEGGKTGLQFDLPQILRVDVSDGFTWQIVKDGRVTVEMTATLKPANGGAATDVAGSVKLMGGETPVSAKGIELAFANALDSKLAKFGADSGLDAEQLARARQYGNTSLTATAILEDPLAIARAGLQAELDERRLERKMAEDREREEANRGVNFRPGQPMIDVDPAHRRAGQ